MEAIVLAGGLGTRLRSVVHDVPKPMADINGLPFLKILLDYLAIHEFKRVILAVGYKHEAIVSFFGSNHAGMELIYNVETERLGTGGALKQCYVLTQNKTQFVLNGDSFYEFDFERMQVLSQGGVPVMASVKVEDVSRYGALELEGDLVVKINEKGGFGPGLINAGCYLFSRDIFNGFDTDGRFSLETTLLRGLSEQRRLKVCVSEGSFIDIGIPNDLEKARRMFT